MADAGEISGPAKHIGQEARILTSEEYKRLNLDLKIS